MKQKQNRNEYPLSEFLALLPWAMLWKSFQQSKILCWRRCEIVTSSVANAIMRQLGDIVR